MAVGLHKDVERVLQGAEGLRGNVHADHAHDLALVADKVRGALERAAVDGLADVVGHKVDV